MNKIIKKVQYSEKVFRFDVEAPLIAKSRKAGNFVIIRVDNNSERMPLTIADAEKAHNSLVEYYNVIKDLTTEDLYY